ncbi:hypothetical protein CRG98_035502 [Punica granatum]|uniref:Uncharacterized protein n=1 Tax=Punica granatum TaxID=22663 RepID=A0A2I0IK79_PUNGR|nr:hypothetical protein CRG98_035502 [Punica granatum]
MRYRFPGHAAVSRAAGRGDQPRQPLLRLREADWHGGREPDLGEAALACLAARELCDESGDSLAGEVRCLESDSAGSGELSSTNTHGKWKEDGRLVLRV